MPALVLIAMLALAAVAPHHGTDSRPEFGGRMDWRNRSS